MKLEPELKKYKDKETGRTVPREGHITETVSRAKETFYMKEQKGVLSYGEFLWIQLKYIKKRWWSLQLLLLVGFWYLLTLTAGAVKTRQELGVVSVLFIILAIPELWRNRNSCALEIESASFYSLRQIYAARMVLFAMVDVILLSAFCCVTFAAVKLSAADLMVQFLLPMSVTACICFQVLCSRRHLNEVAAIGLCIFWNGVWTLIMLNEVVYAAITPQVWFILLVISVIYLCIAVLRTLESCNNYWEENQAWN